MKKQIKIILAAVIIAMLAVPAMAATQWSFTGGLYYKTFWHERNWGSHYPGEDMQNGGAELKKDGRLDWATQSDTYIAMEMVTDHLEGYIELQYDFDENSVKTSYFWGRYNFNDSAAILIGQTDPLFMQEISSQVAFDNMNLNGMGTANAGSLPMIALEFGGFTVALAKPVAEIGAMIDMNNGVFGEVVDPEELTYDQDTFMPQIHASYAYEADEWRFKVAGAFANTRIKDVSYNGSRVSGNKNINSWLVGVDGQMYFGPLTLGAAASYGQNWELAGWNESELGLGYPIIRETNNGFKFESTNSLMVSVVGAYQLTEALGFEAGVGYRRDDNNRFDKASNVLAAYVQAAYEVAPGFMIIPEIGYIDYGKNTGYKIYGDKVKGKSQGYEWYAGVQWALEF